MPNYLLFPLICYMEDYVSVRIVAEILTDVSLEQFEPEKGNRHLFVVVRRQYDIF